MYASTFMEKPYACPQHAADAFIRFKEVVTGTVPGKAPTPDPDEVRIGELER